MQVKIDGSRKETFSELVDGELVTSEFWQVDYVKKETPTSAEIYTSVQLPYDEFTTADGELDENAALMHILQSLT